MNHPPPPYTGKDKPDKNPTVPINDYCDYLLVFAIILGFIITQYNLSKTNKWQNSN